MELKSYKAKQTCYDDMVYSKVRKAGLKVPIVSFKLWNSFSYLEYKEVLSEKLIKIIVLDDIANKSNQTLAQKAISSNRVTANLIREIKTE